MNKWISKQKLISLPWSLLRVKPNRVSGLGPHPLRLVMAHKIVWNYLYIGGEYHYLKIGISFNARYNNNNDIYVFHST